MEMAMLAECHPRSLSSWTSLSFSFSSFCHLTTPLAASPLSPVPSSAREVAEAMVAVVGLVVVVALAFAAAASECSKRRS